jgi:hypothetical protein
MHCEIERKEKHAFLYNRSTVCRYFLVVYDDVVCVNRDLEVWYRLDFSSCSAANAVLWTMKQRTKRKISNGIIYALDKPYFHNEESSNSSANRSYQG